MRRFLSLAFVCALVGMAGMARAQEIDLAVGGNALWSPKNPTASVGFLPPPLKGGVYPSVSVEYLKENHWGLLAEGAFSYHYRVYNDYQTFRPIIYDVNGVYTAELAHKTRGDFMAGIGGETLLFYAPYYNCGIPTGGCQTFTDSTHFLFHAGVGIRYTVWRKIFVRPEAHWYLIPNNYQFHSDNLFRVGASVGYTFGQ
ncbi:MAG TPA: hypothetical protein VGG04_09775 [Candidatus Sulfotelmatobacter sp.]